MTRFSSSINWRRFAWNNSAQGDQDIKSNQHKPLTGLDCCNIAVKHNLETSHNQTAFGILSAKATERYVKLKKKTYERLMNNSKNQADSISAVFSTTFFLSCFSLAFTVNLLRLLGPHDPKTIDRGEIWRPRNWATSLSAKSGGARAPCTNSG